MNAPHCLEQQIQPLVGIDPGRSTDHKLGSRSPVGRPVERYSVGDDVNGNTQGLRQRDRPRPGT